MGIRNLSTASISTGAKRSKFWDQTSVYAPSSYESIATATVGSGGSTGVTFSNIPSTYSHLEIRATTLNASNFYTIKLRFNGSSSGYNASQLTSFNATSTSGGGPDADTGAMIGVGARNATSYSAISIAKIYEYTKTNLYKRWIATSGTDGNGTGQTKVTYGYWASTDAITSIYCYADGSTMNEHTTFALYGIKGA